MQSRRHLGFSLIELIVALLVLSILASMAIPGIQDYLKNVRRDDAKQLLLLNAQRLQRCFTLEGIYNGNCVTRPLSNDGYYSLSIEATSHTFVLTAVPVAGTSQATDTGCQLFVYDHLGSQTAIGTESDRCW